MSNKLKVALVVLVIMILSVPVGLLTSAPAFGEWDPDYYLKKLGFIPKGMQHIQSLHLQHPLLPDYSLPGTNDVLGYYISAIIGAALVFIIWFIIGKIIAKKHSANS